MEEFTVTVGNFEVSVKRTPNDCVFSVVHDGIAFEGKSLLKRLSFVEHMESYMSSSKLELKCLAHKIELILPVPFSSRTESVYMHQLTTDEHLKFCLGKIKSLSEELRRQKKPEETFYESWCGEDNELNDRNATFLTLSEIDGLCRSLELNDEDFINGIQSKHGIRIEQILVNLSGFVAPGSGRRAVVRNGDIFSSISEANFQYAEFLMKYTKSDKDVSFKSVGSGGIMPSDLQYIRICNMMNGPAFCQVKSAFRGD